MIAEAARMTIFPPAAAGVGGAGGIDPVVGTGGVEPVKGAVGVGPAGVTGGVGPVVDAAGALQTAL